MHTRVAVRSFIVPLALLAFSGAASAQISVGISVNFGPPAIPVYEQPMCPAEGYLWVPGYWAYDDDAGYYWVPGTWVAAPQPGFLWTPGYWGWGGSAFVFHEGYWGPHVGFYGGINYGFGYGGAGYEGGRWEGGRFSYNTYVNRVNTTVIHNTYNVRVTNVTETRVSYNGGSGGVPARATPQEESYANERHVRPVPVQTRHVQAAHSNPQLRASANQGKPPIAATARPSDFKAGVVPSRQAGGQYKAPPSKAAHGNVAPTGTHPATYNHASELQPHASTTPNTGNPATDKRYQDQQAKLAAKQAQDHQRLQQQQEKEHQQAANKNYNDAQKQQVEQHHAQQTQQLEQKHAAQQKQMEQHQAPHQPAPKPPESHPPAEKPHS